MPPPEADPSPAALCPPYTWGPPHHQALPTSAHALCPFATLSPSPLHPTEVGMCSWAHDSTLAEVTDGHQNLIPIFPDFCQQPSASGLHLRGCPPPLGPLLEPRLLVPWLCLVLCSTSLMAPKAAAALRFRPPAQTSPGPSTDDFCLGTQLIPTQLH